MTFDLEVLDPDKYYRVQKGRRRFEYWADEENPNLVGFITCCDEFQNVLLGRNRVRIQLSESGDDGVLILDSGTRFEHPVRFCPCCGARGVYHEKDPTKTEEDTNGHTDSTEGH